MSASKPGLLHNIRQQIVDRQNASTKKPCPKCGDPLTIEEKEFFHTEVCEHCFDHCKIVAIESCCKEPYFTTVKLVTAGGGIQVRKQCKCGFVSPSALPGFDKAAKDRLPLMNSAARDSYENSKNDSYRNFDSTWRQKKNKVYQSRRDQIRDNWLKDYNKYLDSPQWREKRSLVLKRDEYLCQCCLQNTATQVHHKSYQFEDLTGAVPAFDLISVCGPCHERIEEMKKQNRIQ